MTPREQMHAAAAIGATITAITVVFLVAILWPAMCRAQEVDSRWHVHVHGASAHFGKREDGRPYNWRNAGIGVEYEHSRALAGLAGIYNNSLNDWSGYALARWTPTEIASWRLGGVVGLASGYEANNGGPTPVAALAAISPEIVGGVSVQLVGLPNGLHPKITGFAAISFRIRFD